MAEDERILLLNIKREWEEEKENIRDQILAVISTPQIAPAEPSREAI